VERVLSRERRVLREAADAVLTQEYERMVGSTVPPADDVPPVPPVAAPPAIEEEQEQRARRVARYEEVMALHAQGQSMRRSRASRD